MFNGLRKLLAFAFLVSVSIAANAFVPAPGLWSIVPESTQNLPGRGITIEVENNILVLTYYGYRPDGTSAFYTAAGSLSNNTFSASLTEFQNGTPVGQSYTPASAKGTSPGTVSITFTNGLTGTITLPGESAKAIAKYSFGYGKTPADLMGTYFLVYRTSSAIYGNATKLSRLSGRSTANGNGIVTDSLSKFACENVVLGIIAGQTICTEVGSTGYENAYAFKMSGDRGAGTGWWASNTTFNPSQVIRTATKDGNLTGINDSTSASLATASGLKEPNIGGASVEEKMQSQAFETLKDREPQGSFRGIQLTADEQEALKQWTLEARRILGQ